nr:helix-turn-helix transcriptional regulator [uncultured Brevundimonas sp.]
MTEAIDPFDVALGARIRTRREAQRITQAQLAGGCDVTFQQIQKYERGVNRVSVARLAQMAAVLKAHPAEFFGAPQASTEDDALTQLGRVHDGLDLAEAYMAMTREHRAALMMVARSFAAGATASELKLAKAA